MKKRLVFWGSILILTGTIFNGAIGLIPLNRWLFILGTVVQAFGVVILIYIDKLNGGPEKRHKRNVQIIEKSRERTAKMIARNHKIIERTNAKNRERADTRKRKGAERRLAQLKAANERLEREKAIIDKTIENIQK